MENGAKFGRYEIRKLIGAGGMGEVFLAQDSELDRPVALKVLPAEFGSNQERVRRFKQEARAASALNHPNIITIYEIAEVEERLFIATEFIDGETLRRKIEKNDVTVFDAVSIAEQVASALAVAHDARIIHRDIKPENIMIRRDGYVKILDFGLAKPSINQSGNTRGTEDKTLQMVTTQAGMVMGSVSYMSPEQARGKDVDERTDIWSLGVVLYELVTGKNPFAGETVSDSLAALIHIEPDPLDAYVEDVPEELQWIVRKTLRKKADDRYQSIKDLALDLKDLRYKFEHGDSVDNRTLKFNAYNVKTAAVGRISTGETKTLIHHTASADNVPEPKKTDANKTQVYAPLQRRGSWRFLPFLVLGLAAILAFGAWFYQPFSPAIVANKFDNVQISRITENGKSNFPAISPDGRYVAYVNNENGMRSLYVRQIATGSNVQIAAPTNLVFIQPTFSPDGDYIYYTLVDKGIGTLYQVPTLGGASKKIMVDVDSRASFSPDGKRLAFIRHDIETGSSAVYLINSDGSSPEFLINTQSSGESRFSEIAWAPAGDEILISTVVKIFGDDSYEGKILVVSLKDKTARPLSDRSWINLSSLSWLNDKTGFYFLAKANVQEPKQIWFFSYPDQQIRQITSDSSGYHAMSLSFDGETIAASRVDLISSLYLFSPQNKEMTQVVSENRMMQGVGGLTHLPDGRILFARTQGTRTNLWTMDEDGRNERPFMNDEGGDNIHPSISPDGKFIVFTSNRKDGWRIWKADIDGKNSVQLTRQSAVGDFRPQILQDNKTVVFERRLDNIMKSKLMKVSIDGGGAEEQNLFGENQVTDAFPSVSGDGKRLAFMTHQFDAKNLTFQTLLKLAAVKPDGSVEPPKETKIDNMGWKFRWSKDAKNITYIGMQGVTNIFDVASDTSAGVKPKQLTNFNSGSVLNFDWANDGKRLFVVRGIVNSDLILIKDTGK